jgi:paraquat-inducible protein A
MLPPIHECPDCGLFSRLSPPVAGTDMRCQRCDCILRRVRRNPLETALACALTGLIFYIITVQAPFLQVLLYGRERVSLLSSGPMELDNQGFWLLAAIVLLGTVLVPLIKLLGTIYVLVGLRFRHPPPGLVMVFTWLRHIGPWAMIDVYMLGFLVAYTRLQAIMYVHIGMGVYALVGLMIAMIAADAALDPEAVWEAMQPRGLAVFRPRAPAPGEILIGCDTCHQVSHAKEGDDCPRCSEELYIRKPDSVNRGWAFMITAAILYIPSNIFPIMTVVRFGRAQSYTIYAGMMELAHIGLMPLAVLVFTASIAIPCFKLLVLGYTLIQTQRGVGHELRMRTRLYRVIDFIGRWSMVDVFMVSILVALVRFGQFAQITADVGAFYFASVVILTLFAVESFDPRLMWDRGAPDHNRVARSQEYMSL